MCVLYKKDINIETPETVELQPVSNQPTPPTLLNFYA